MRTLLATFIIALCFTTVQAQVNISADQWREDLRFLQSNVHEEYPFLFKKTTRENFDGLVEELYNSIPQLQEHEIIVGLARIVASFKYGHTSLGISGWPDREVFNFNQMPYNLMIFADGIFVQGTSKAYEQALGARVLEVEGMPVEQALAAVKTALPSENDQFFKAYGMSFLGTPEILHAQGVTPTLKKAITLTLEKDGKKFTQKFKPIDKKGFPGQYSYIQEGDGWLDARDQSTDPLYLKNLERIYFFEYLPHHKALYVRHSQIEDDSTEDIPEFYDRVFDFINSHDVEKMILDVRLNGGGNNYKNKPVITGIIKSKINVPGKLFVITGGRTFSACQNLVNELDNYTNAIFVGEPTGENINFYGDNRRVSLPNSRIPVYLSFAWWQDKPQWENDEWLAPHIYVEMTFDDYAANRDPVLDAALEFEMENFILDPMQHLTNLFLSGQTDQLLKDAARIVSDSAYRFFDFEKEFTSAGYNLMAQGQTETAIYVFQMVAGFFPNSANAWKSLAEAQWKNGNIDGATDLFKKAISMDPDGRAGAAAKEMLEKIHGQ